MTTPSDPSQPGDGSSGYQSGMPGYPAAPPPMEAERTRFTPPTEITAAFWSYVAAAVVGLVGGVLVLGQKQQILDALRNSNTAGLTDAQLQSAADIGVITALVISVIIGALYLLFAFKLKAGRNWARIVLTVIAALALVSLVVGRGGTVLGYIGELAAVVGAVLSYLPKSSAYISAVKHSR